MIWNDTRLHQYVAAGMVDPFDPALVNPASIDLRLGAQYRLPHPAWGMRANGRPLRVNVFWGEQQEMGPDGIELGPGQFILCCTLETVRIPAHAAAELFSKSSAGRIGLEHLHAGWIDPGFRGQLTLELKNVAPWLILLTPGMRLMQMVVHDLTAPAARDYGQTGRYQNQTGATPAKGAKEATHGRSR